MQTGDLFPNLAPIPKTDADWFSLDTHASLLFTPHTPIDEKELFAGRVNLIDRVIEVVFQEGQHAVLFGERGVGKSSLANILKEKIFSKTQALTVIKRNCTSDHNFKLIWQHIFSDFNYGGTTAAEWLETHQNPFDIYQLVQAFSAGTRPIFIIDEFDRVTDEKTKVMMADTIKYLSDYGAKATVIVVGVAENVNELFVGHQSITRAIDQILMPMMDPPELRQILVPRFKLLNMSADDSAIRDLVALSQGLPGYTHLLGQATARSAIKRRSLKIEPEDIGSAITLSVEKLDQTIKAAYLNATRSTKPKNQYRQVLLACALSNINDRGFFSAGAVRKPFSKIMNREMFIPSFARHLKEFCESSRGPALIKGGKPKGYEYRFAEPLLRPYVVIRGVADGLIAKEDL